jgi:hypothetical protein
MQRWNDRLHPQEFRISEDYLAGRLTLIVNLEINIRGIACPSDSIAAFTDERAVMHSQLSVSHINAPNGRHGDGRNDQKMLVLDVQAVQIPKVRVPSVVRFNFVQDHIEDGRRYGLFQSLIDGRYEFIPGFAEWEVGVNLGVIGLMRDSGKFGEYQVQTGSQVMDRVTQDQRDTIRHWLNRILHKCVSGIHVVLDTKTVEVTVEERFKDAIQIVDVLIGPFDLPPRSKEYSRR